MAHDLSATHVFVDLKAEADKARAVAEQMFKDLPQAMQDTKACHKATTNLVGGIKRCAKDLSAPQMGGAMAASPHWMRDLENTLTEANKKLLYANNCDALVKNGTPHLLIPKTEFAGMDASGAQGHLEKIMNNRDELGRPRVLEFATRPAPALPAAEKIAAAVNGGSVMPSDETNPEIVKQKFNHAVLMQGPQPTYSRN